MPLVCAALDLRSLLGPPAVPERISLPGISKKSKSKKEGGRGSPSDVMTASFAEECDEDGGLHEMDTVYINLDKRVDRKKLIQGEMKQQGLKGRRFSAKSGDDVKDSQVARSWHSRLNCLYDKKTIASEHTMSKGERGCSGSHLALWKQCAKRDDATKPMLVLEDDAVLWDRSGVQFPELCSRLIRAVEQLYDVENEPVMLYVGCEVTQWRDSRRVVVEGPPVMKLREAEYLWQTSSYILWPAAARVLLAHLPIDSPTDCYIAKLVLEGKITAMVATPALAEQRDPYEKGDIKHTNIYNWEEAKVEKAKQVSREDSRRQPATRRHTRRLAHLARPWPRAAKAPRRTTLLTRPSRTLTLVFTLGGGGVRRLKPRRPASAKPRSRRPAKTYFVQAGPSYILGALPARVFVPSS